QRNGVTRFLLALVPPAVHSALGRGSAMSHRSACSGNRMSWLRSLVAIALLLAPLAASANEARCGALGANCLCSETADTTSDTQNPGSGFFDPDGTNTTACPSDFFSTDTFSYYDDDASAGGGTGTPAHLFVSQTGMPGGASVSHVLRWNKGSGRNHFWG